MSRRDSQCVAGVLLGTLALLLCGCLWEHPACYAPVWSPDGERLYYVAARPDGTLTVRRADLGSREGGELAASHLPDPPIAMALAPRGDRVACAVPTRRNGRPAGICLHVLSAGGSSDRVLWRAPAARSVELCWTPDGKAIVVAAARQGGGSLTLVPVAGGKPEPLRSDLADVRTPAVSPDGTRIAFAARPPSAELWSLRVLDLDGRREKVVATGLFRTVHAGYGPAWSPDGATVAYVAERFATEGFAEIRAWDAASGKHRTVARTVAGACIAPAWSPSGDALAFVRLPFGSGVAGPSRPGAGDRPAEIAVVDAAGSQQRALVADGLSNLMPAWSPDGRTLAFATLAQPTAHHHVVRLVDVHTAHIRLAEDTPENRFLLGMARHERGSTTGLHQALAELPAITDPAARAHAHGLVAEVYARLGQWELVAEHAAAPGDAAPGPARRLLAEAQMRLGRPADARATAERLAQDAGDKTAQRLLDRLTGGLGTLATLNQQLARKRSPALLFRLAALHHAQLGNPRAALACYLDLIEQFPDYPRLPAAAAGAFDCYAQLPAHPPTYAVLERLSRLVGPEELTRDRIHLLATAAVAGGQPDVAATWLERLPPEVWPAHTAEIWSRVAGAFEANGRPDRALDAWTGIASAGPSAARARAAASAAELLAARGRHAEAARRLADAFRPEADVPTLRQAMRLVARGRLHRADDLAYGTARVGQLAAFGFLETALREGEQFITGLPPGDPRRGELRRLLGPACRQLASFHLASGDAVRARAVVTRWLRWASPKTDLATALATLADCHEAARQRRALVETLTRIVLEFPDRPEAADARRRLLLLDTAPRR